MKTFVVEYHPNGNLACELQKPGEGPGGLQIRKFYEDGKLEAEIWNLSDGPDGLLQRIHDKNGTVLLEMWEDDKHSSGMKHVYLQMVNGVYMH